MKLFTIGPVEMYPSTRAVRIKGVQHFRTTEYGNLVKSCLKRLQNLLGTTTEDGLIYMASSGTGAMEAVIDNCITKNDNVLIINGGAFGHRFCELCDWYKIKYSSIDLAWNETLTAEHLHPYNNQKYTALIVNLHETGTGQLYDIKMLSEFCRRNNMYLIVDAISTFLADDYEMDKYGIDITIFSSQKGLCLSPGGSFVAFSERMKQRVLNLPNPQNYYFNFKNYIGNIDRGQTPFTPPVCVMYELEDMLNMIDKAGGKEQWIAKIDEKAKYFRAKAKSLGFKLQEFPQSNLLTSLYFEDVSAYDVFVYLKDNFQIYINPCGGELATKLFRVSHIGNTSVSDIDDLFDKIQIAIKEIKKGAKND